MLEFLLPIYAFIFSSITKFIFSDLIGFILYNLNLTYWFNFFWLFSVYVICLYILSNLNIPGPVPVWCIRLPLLTIFSLFSYNSIILFWRYTFYTICYYSTFVNLFDSAVKADTIFLVRSVCLFSIVVFYFWRSCNLKKTYIIALHCSQEYILSQHLYHKGAWEIRVSDFKFQS